MAKDKNLGNRSLDTEAHPPSAKPNSKKRGLRSNGFEKGGILKGGLSRFDQAQDDLSHTLMKVRSVEIVSVYRSSKDGGQMLGDRRYIYASRGVWRNSTEINDVQINPWGAVCRNSMVGVEKIGSGKTHGSTPKAYKTNSWGGLGTADHLDSILKGGQGRCAPSDLSKYKTQRVETLYSSPKGSGTNKIESLGGLRVGMDAAAAEIGKYHEAGDVEAHE